MKKLALLLSPLPVLSVAVLSVGACVDPVLPGTTEVDLAPFVDDGARLQGIAKDPVGTDLHVLVEGRGLLQINRDGQLVQERKVGENGLEDRAYKDVAVVGNGRFLFIADNEGYLYDEVAGIESVFFCVEPGFNDCTDENGNWADDDGDGLCNWQDDQPQEPLPEPLEPVGDDVTQKNDALTLAGSAILAAPRFYEDDRQIEASLRTYDVANGDPTGSVDLSGLGLDIKGLDIDGDTLMGVSGSKLVRFSLDGEEQGSADLDVSDGKGLVVDGDDVLVLDADGRKVVAFAKDDLR